MVNFRPMGMFADIWYLPPKAKNEPPIVNAPARRFSTTHVPEVNVAPVDGRLVETTPVESIRMKNPVGPLIPKESPRTMNEPSACGWRANA